MPCNEEVTEERLRRIVRAVNTGDTRGDVRLRLLQQVFFVCVVSRIVSHRVRAIRRTALPGVACRRRPRINGRLIRVSCSVQIPSMLSFSARVSMLSRSHVRITTFAIRSVVFRCVCFSHGRIQLRVACNFFFRTLANT
jgi:hypothetical protein